jgi:hypothetical protein
VDRTINRRAVFSALLAGSCLPSLFADGDTDLAGVPVHMLRHEDGPRRYLVIHGDEDTAKQVLTDHMKTHAGVGYVVTGDTRNVEMRGLKIDPNRMWSRVGAELSLRKLNKNPDAAQVKRVLDELDRRRPEAVRRLIPVPRSRLFALHNNRDYSIDDELGASDRTSVPQPDMPRYFFLCTDPGDFEKLKTSPYNVVLQSKAEPDDGSLSRLAARRGFRYVNLECAIGDYAGQRERVDWLEQNLGG